MDVQERIAKYLDEIEKAVSTSAEFAADQAPQLVQEFLAWEFWSNAVCCVTFAIMAWLSIVLFRKAWNAIPVLVTDKGWSGDSDRGLLKCISFVLVCALVPVFSCVSIGCAEHAMKVKIAPRVVLLEKVGSLIKGLK